METKTEEPISTDDPFSNIQFSDIFNIEEIQHIQDLFANVNGVASIITTPDGNPITKPSNFTRLCNNIVRKTEKGLSNCYKSDAEIGKQNTFGPILQDLHLSIRRQRLSRALPVSLPHARCRRDRVVS